MADRHPTQMDRCREWLASSPDRWLVALAAVVVVALVPLIFAGPGTDLDVSAVVRSGQGIVDHFSYVPSRPPGSPVYEVAVGVLHAVGGFVLVNLGSLAMAVVCAWAIWRLCRDEGVQCPVLVTLVVVANPWFLIAATSLEDFLWALGFFLTGVVAFRGKRPWLAGVLFALAIGSRSTTVLFIAVVLAATAWDGREARRPSVIAGGTAAVLGVVLFIPAYLSAGSSFRFLDNEFATSTLFVQLGRFLTKDLALFGPLAVVVLLAAVPSVFRSRSQWSSSWLFRFGVLGLVVSQLLFLRFPWKMGHLLPSVVFAAFVLGVALQKRPRLLQALIVAQVFACVVAITVLAPNHPNDATGGRVQVGVSWGPLVRDTTCRLRYRHDVLSPVREVRERAGICASPFPNDAP